MAMLIDLILKPWVERKNLPLYLWMDNCSLHTTPCLEQVYADARTAVGLLPPNMTSELQVLDLVVNGPIKAHIRNLRASRLGDYLDDFKSLLRAREGEDESELMPKWSPPKPNLHECIEDVIRLFSTVFTTQKFKSSVARSFVRTGTAYDEKGNFAIYKASTGLGTMKSIQVERGMLHLTEDDFFETIVDDDNDNDIDNNADI